VWGPPLGRRERSVVRHGVWGVTIPPVPWRGPAGGAGSPEPRAQLGPGSWEALGQRRPWVRRCSCRLAPRTSRDRSSGS
jgi:hypothetical protein